MLTDLREKFNKCNPLMIADAEIDGMISIIKLEKNAVGHILIYFSEENLRILVSTLKADKYCTC
jgi:hypothetical protein